MLLSMTKTNSPANHYMLDEFYNVPEKCSSSVRRRKTTLLVLVKFFRKQM